MESLNTRLRTWFPSVRWPTLWRSPKGGGATPSAGSTKAKSGPVGYLVNHPAGLSGSQGIGCDYVLGLGGVYVQSESAHLTARALIAPAVVRGLAPVSEKVELTHGPMPAHLFELGLRWFRALPDTERFFAVRWGGDAYRLVVPPQAGTGASLTYQPPTGVVAEFHSHGRPAGPSSRPPTTGMSRASGSTASWDASMTLKPELSSPHRRLRLLRPAGLVPGVRLAPTRASGWWAQNRNRQETSI